MQLLAVLPDAVCGGACSTNRALMGVGLSKSVLLLTVLEWKPL